MDPTAPEFWLLAAIVGGAFAIEATSGFGATILIVTFGAHLFPIPTLLPVIVPLGLVLSVALAWRNRVHVDRGLVVRRILPLMGLGVAIGLAIFERASNDGLRRALGCFVVGVALAELWRMRLAADPMHAPRPLPPMATRAALLGAGVIHGLFSSGGPLLVYALGRLPIEKRAFRATLSTVWVVLASALTLAYAWQGRVGPESLLATAALLPVLATAFVVGDWAHHRLDEATFRVLIYLLLIVAGLSNAF
ncbi:MAG: sulfite exporter TauE/SafE family protein [Myxococcota bacterium]|nr:sulfite exporter TauE/SafE family protein [Myxococcota bacterium]